MVGVILEIILRVLSGLSRWVLRLLSLLRAVSIIIEWIVLGHRGSKLLSIERVLIIIGVSRVGIIRGLAHHSGAACGSWAHAVLLMLRLLLLVEVRLLRSLSLWLLLVVRVLTSVGHGVVFIITLIIIKPKSLGVRELVVVEMLLLLLLRVVVRILLSLAGYGLLRLLIRERLRGDLGRDLGLALGEAWLSQVVSAGNF